jgi:RNA polymerase sigma factor (sigma-70 family)
MSKFYKNLSDTDLVEKLNNLDTLAFEVVYNRYWDEMFCHAVKIGGDVQRAQDTIQDIFTSLFVKMGNYPVAIPLKSYLYTALRNINIGHYRHDKIKAKYFNNYAIFNKEGESVVDNTVRENELKVQIEQGIDTLPPKMRSIFEMSRKAYLSHKEIAEASGVSEGTVKKQLYYAISKLRSRLTCILLFHFMQAILMLNKIY